MRRANGAILGILLATVAVPAFAADMPVKAAPPAPPPPDWSGVYIGGAVGGAWGRERLDRNSGLFDNPDLLSSQLFGTSATRMFESNVLIQPPFIMESCILSNCNGMKTSGVIAGGFAGVQKQWGNWVVGLEGSWDFLSLKKTLSATEVDIESVTRSVLSTNAILPSFGLTIPAQTNLPVVGGQVTLPQQTLNVSGVNVTVPGQTLQVQPVNITIPQQIVTVPGQSAPVNVTVNIAGQTVTGTIDPTTTTFGPATLRVNLGFPIGTISIPIPAIPVPLNGQVNTTIPGQTATGTGNATVGPTQVTIPAQIVTVPGQALVVQPQTITVSGQTVTIPQQILPVVGATVTVPTQVVTVPAQTVILPGNGLPTLTTVRAAVTRTASVSSKIDEVADLRGKIGLTNLFFGSNFLLYATGGASIAHLQHSLSLTQTVQRISEGGAPIGDPRSNSFDAVSGDTRIGWVVGAGLDWKLTPNFILGVLYRHHEFPKGTVAFNDATNAVGFGTSKVSLDSVQGRLSVLFPIQ
jgi:opacity protein-like surface antigen